MNVYDVIRRPLITEKGHVKREEEGTLCFEVHKDANKIEIKQAVETVSPATHRTGRRLMSAWPRGRNCLNIPKSKGSSTPCP
jgi:hypothetical protein